MQACWAARHVAELWKAAGCGMRSMEGSCSALSSSASGRVQSRHNQRQQAERTRREHSSVVTRVMTASAALMISCKQHLFL